MYYFFLGSGNVMPHRVNTVPVVVFSDEVERHHVTADGGHLETDRFAAEAAIPLVHVTRSVRACQPDNHIFTICILHRKLV